MSHVGEGNHKMIKHEFGGDWTEEKLSCLQKYLEAYRTIFTSNKSAKHFTNYYVDAFAGTGFRNSSNDLDQEDTTMLFEKDEVDDIQNYFEGSVIKALEIKEPFHKYLFIDNKPEYIESLKKIKEDYHNIANRIQIVQAEANNYLINWCNTINWKRNRAVIFLDPYGMEVDWRLIEAIGKTKAIDMWLLFPLGVAVNRMLTKNRMPQESWANLLTRTFGTDKWKDFYIKTTQFTLWGKEQVTQKMISLKGIEDFFTNRLAQVFPEVARKPLQLRNSKNNPLYLLCFASANRNGVKIAEDIMWKIDGRQNGCK